MCGIAGILKYDQSRNVDHVRLKDMSDMLIHRGPDGSGIMVNGRIGLAHRRLAIIDLKGGQQPLGTPGRELWITYNGELYNFLELRALLQLRGCHFHTHSDTEVVLRAYEAFGNDCVEHLRGMFAFAIWDGSAKKLFLARDRIGIKPLYFAHDESELLFASEIKAILKARIGKPVFNRAILPEFIAARFNAGSATFFEGIWKLMPAHTLSWTEQDGIKQHRYWQPPLASGDSTSTYQDHVKQVRIGLEDAVKSHLVSDVPVGLFLSGGLDSTILSALMAQQVSGAIQTFSVGFKEKGANELSFARLAAKSVHAQHREVEMTPIQFFDVLPKLIWHEDEPIAFPSSIPLYHVSRLAQKHVKVVLTGEGADELFLGYDYRYRVTAWNTRFGGLYEKLLPGKFRNRTAQYIPSLPKQLRRYVERSFMSLACNPREMFFENFSVFRFKHRDSMLLDQSTKMDVHVEGLRLYQAAGDDVLECMSYTDLQTYLVELLMKQDQMSMAASIESRVPFLDHLLVEQVASIPSKHRLYGWQTKSLLRDAVKDLIPPEIMSRGKMGFPVPISDWLRGEYWPLVQEFVLGARVQSRGIFNLDYLKNIAHEHRSGENNHSDRLWLLINLEIWHRIFIDGEDPARIYLNSIKLGQPGSRGFSETKLVMQ